MTSHTEMGPWRVVAGTWIIMWIKEGRSRYPRPYLLHQTPLHSESRKSALGARFGSLLSALSRKRTHTERD